jgi:intracellular multiplication protein IcmJ
MQILSISLGVRHRSDAKEAVSKNRFPTKKQMVKILERDAYACRCCGFQSKKFQNVVSSNLLPNQDDVDGEFITVCSFCELTMTMERAGITGSGYIIWLPELNQAQLNHVMRSLYIAKRSDDEKLKNAAIRTIDVLTLRRSEAKKRLGTDDPLIFATACHELVSLDQYKNRKSKLEGLRFLPFDRHFVRQKGKEIDVFNRMVEYWTSFEGPYAKLPVSEWTKLFEEVFSQVE